MAKLPEEVYNALQSAKSIKVMATVDKEKVLNVVPIGSIKAIGEETLAFANVFPESRNKKNIESTRRVAIAVFEAPDGYQIKGTFLKWHTSGEVFDEIASEVNKTMQKLGVDQKVEEVGTIKVNEVYALSIPVAGTKLA